MSAPLKPSGEPLSRLLREAARLARGHATMLRASHTVGGRGVRRDSGVHEKEYKAARLLAERLQAEAVQRSLAEKQFATMPIPAFAQSNRSA
jgi:hypothetical protein